MCFGVRLGCISKPEQTSQTETMKHVETFLDCFGNQFYVIPWFKLFRSPFYRRYEKSADYLKRFQFILDNKDWISLKNRNISLRIFYHKIIVKVSHEIRLIVYLFIFLVDRQNNTLGNTRNGFSRAVHRKLAKVFWAIYCPTPNWRPLIFREHW